MHLFAKICNSIKVEIKLTMPFQNSNVRLSLHSIRTIIMYKHNPIEA